MWKQTQKFNSYKWLGSNDCDKMLFAVRTACVAAEIWLCISCIIANLSSWDLSEYVFVQVEYVFVQVEYVFVQVEYASLMPENVDLS